MLYDQGAVLWSSTEGLNSLAMGHPFEGIGVDLKDAVTCALFQREEE